MMLHNMEEKKQIFDMGNATSGIFRGNSTSDATKEVYGKSASLFSEIIKSKLPETEKEYSLLDIGSSKGEFLSDVLGFLPSYRFDVTVTDTNPDAVAKNLIVGKKIVADAELLPFENKSFDVILMRYVLQFNLFKGQKKIIDEIARTVKQIAIVQHAGPDNKNAKLWREKVGSIFSNDKLPQIQRSGMYWSSAEEVEGYMAIKGIKFERVSSNEIHGLSQVYIERYSMNSEQAGEVRKLIDDMDYLFQTTWVIYPNVIN
jgi:ubiquinone/menaquinone biosynthesis C-methylase UbiE